MLQRFLRPLLSAIFLLALASLAANNGKVAFAYPLTDVTIDGRVDDWPPDTRRYPIAHHNGAQPPPDGEEAYFMVGYETDGRSLLLAVVTPDEDHVRTPDDADYQTHDLQVLYLDLRHDPQGSGVVAYELDPDHRKIVHRTEMPWYPEVAAAGWENVETSVRHVAGVTVYEWRVGLGEAFVAGRTLGFDYAIFDKDAGRDSRSVQWGPGGPKASNANRLGDLVLLPAGQRTATVTGQLVWAEQPATGWPAQVDLHGGEGDGPRLSAAVDTGGRYTLEVPADRYRVEVPEDIVWNKWFDLRRVGGREAATVTVAGPEPVTVGELTVAQLPRPDFIGSKGLLHAPFSWETAATVDSFVEAYRAYYDIPAVSLALIKDGRLVYHRGYGVENSITQRPLRREAVFEAASVTKPVFAYVVNRLVQRGEFDLDRPLHEQLPFPELEAYPEYRKMTARHVLTHVSGLPNWGARMVAAPGEKLGYSGEGFEYLKRVIAGGDGDQLPDTIQALLEREVLHPFGLTNTYFRRHPKLLDRGVSGHAAHRPTLQEYGTVPGMAYSMHTEARDFAAFALALLERRGLEPERARDMFTIHTEDTVENQINPGYRSGFGLGIALRESPFGPVFGHGGNNGDFRCQFEVYDDLKMGYVIFTNSSTGGPLLLDAFRLLVEGKAEPK